MGWIGSGARAAKYVAVSLCLASFHCIAGDASTPEFFEKKIRPALAEHCYKCHSATSEKIKGKLRLDSRAALLKGGETGPGIIPGDPEKSLFIEAVQYTNHDLQMPPKNKLQAAVVQDFVAWVKAGAPWPNEKEAQPAVEEKKNDYEKLRKEHWAFKPVQSPAAPAVKDAAWPKNPIDQLILAKLQEKNIKPAAAADKLTLLRRISFDLTGLPPTPEEIEAFQKDETADAYEKTVDRLLASPRFGERWGRHWLDIARFAESAGGGRIVPYTNAWRYRDYVIDAFNQDKPYDEFVREQIAGDLLPSKDLEQRRKQIIATGYLAVGSKNLDTQDKDLLRMDVVDEQLDTLGKSILGMTIGCARCHDHKFDPIPTREYYALAGIFRSTKTMTPGNVSGVVQTVLPGDEIAQQKVGEYEKKVAALEERIEKLRLIEQAQKPATVATKPAIAEAKSTKFKAAVAASSLPGIVLDNSQANIVGPWIKSVYTKVFVGEGYIHDNNKNKGEMSVAFAPAFPKTGKYEVRFSYSYSVGRSEHVPVLIQHADGETSVEVDESKEPPVDGLFISLGKFKFNQGNDGSVTVSNMGTKGHVTVDAVQFIPVDEVDGAPRPVTEKPADTKPEPAPKTDGDAAQKKQLETELAELKKNPPSGASALAVRDEEQVGDYNVCLRGDVHRLGPPAPRSFLTLCGVEGPTVNPKQSGRVELAQWITDKRNPLTARVMANRIWHHLFGSGIVRTTDNFGTTGETPSHPALLDFLATRFMESGWSTKKIIREIVLSSTYRQSISANAEAARVDPENRLLWRANLRRLEVEAIRDAIVMNSGELELSVSPGDTTAKNAKPRAFRSVYIPLQRESIDEMLEIFDFADTNLVVGKRNTSNLPTQSLFLMNSPFVMEQATKAAQRLLASNTDDKARIDLAYLRTLGRKPSDSERKLSLDFIAAGTESGNAAKAWAQFYQSLFACVDFRYVK